ncbi:MAG: hypothetical protein Q4Q00_07865 [Turicibacter sp.]|nr:hypothetical protein [Turicibacter sp.]
MNALDFKKALLDNNIPFSQSVARNLKEYLDIEFTYNSTFAQRKT